MKKLLIAIMVALAFSPLVFAQANPSEVFLSEIAPLKEKLANHMTLSLLAWTSASPKMTPVAIVQKAETEGLAVIKADLQTEAGANNLDPKLLDRARAELYDTLTEWEIKVLGPAITKFAGIGIL